MRVIWSSSRTGKAAAAALGCGIALLEHNCPKEHLGAFGKIAHHVGRGSDRGHRADRLAGVEGHGVDASSRVPIGRPHRESRYRERLAGNADGAAVLILTP